MKHQLKVSWAFAHSDVSTVIHAITAWHLLLSTSLSGVSRCLAVTVYNSIKDGKRERRASTFRVNDKTMRLGPSCSPTVQHPCICCVNRIYPDSSPFGTERISLFFRSLRLFDDLGMFKCFGHTHQPKPCIGSETPKTFHLTVSCPAIGYEIQAFGTVCPGASPGNGCTIHPVSR